MQVTTTDNDRLSVVETAREMRKRLKAAHPGTRFSVRSSSFAGGTAINVTWTDGALRADVEATVEPMVGSDFDSMHDLLTRRGPIGINGRYVRSGADFISCTRELSPQRTAELQKLAATYCEVEAIDTNAEYEIPGLPHFGHGVSGWQVARLLAEHPAAEAQLRILIAERGR